MRLRRLNTPKIFSGGLPDDIQKSRIITINYHKPIMQDKLIIGGREFDSRLFVGTGKFSSNTLMLESILASGSEMITVAMKRDRKSVV